MEFFVRFLIAKKLLGRDYNKSSHRDMKGKTGAGAGDGDDSLLECLANIFHPVRKSKINQMISYLKRIV